ncbi:MAG: prolyl oligopeptidase family serine peptidase, partial [Candidatus Hydrogenedentes bacterium]|nr:prolyl oligopeptidase family serine peptidase [Candidatus Hydrogenedentota bacterium]
RLHNFFVEQLGGFPERTPLNAQVLGGETLEDYRYEKVVFESRPGLYVAAILYLPLTPPPYPGVIFPCGHEATGKAGETYQRGSILLAKNGIAALCFDPIGQGERHVFFDNEGKPALDSTIQHSLMGAGSIMLGTNIAAYRIWDGMRAPDYLEGRPEVDKTRLGCTGNSGGGTLTSYIMALDPRVQCAVPSCYITSLPRLMATIGPQDGEQTIHAQIAFGMDHADYIHLRAPRPTLLCSATRDFFDISGTWDSFREAKRVYTRLEVPERVSLIEVDEEHGYTKILREGMVRWMRRWLLDVDDEIKEPDFDIRTPESLWCTPNGKVKDLPGAKSPFDFNVELERKYSEKRAGFWRERPREECLAKVRELAGITLPSAGPPAEPRGAINKDGYTIEKLVLRPELGIALPALYFTPAERPVGTVLYLHGESKEADAVPGGAIEALVRAGKAVLAVDLRGIGETAAANKYGGSWELVSPDCVDVARAYLLGKSYVGMRAEDALSCIEWLKNRGAKAVEIIATGKATPPATHAAALAGDFVEHLTLRGGIPSWSEAASTPRAKYQWANAVHGALQWYDLSDLMRTLPADKVTLEDMAVPVF